MNKNVRAALIVAVILGALAWYGVHVMNERAAMTAAAMGTVTESEFVRDSESSSNDQTQVSYSFEVDGKRVDGSDSISGADRTGEYPAGRGIEVCYNPAEPESSRLNRGGSCG